MAANLTTHYPIGALQTVSGNTPFTLSIPEKAAQTFLAGVPVQLNAGFVQKWDGTTFNAGILGVSNIFGSNLASNGLGAPGPFQQIGTPGAIQTWGSVPNEPSAVNIAIGTPITDGRTLVYSAQYDTIFEGQVDNSAGSVPADYTPTEANVGAIVGLTFDANGYAYVDLGKVTAGTNTCVQIIGLSPVDGSIVNARVRFVFTAASLQLPV
jgi:hypothetical protein